jgi:TRAP-type mannitol/chloroaromatic compound transport system, periplasmic component
MTGGQFTMRVYAAGELVPPLQVMDAVMQGTVQAGLSPGYFYIGKHPALAFDTGVPVRAHYASAVCRGLWHGGGLELLNEIWGAVWPFGL